ncbi:protein ripply2-like [Cetorhinus maximus]
MDEREIESQKLRQRKRDEERQTQSETQCKEYSADGIWRPWLITPKDIEEEQQRKMATLTPSDIKQHQQTPTGGKVSAFRHPVKLLWPKSKCFDFLYEDAAYLLANFPVQATISFYQESDSESESDDSN